MSHGAALDAGSGILFENVLAYGLIKGLSKLRNQFLGLIKLLFSKQLAEAAAHVINALVHKLVATSANNALTQGLFGVLEIWHNSGGGPPKLPE